MSNKRIRSFSADKDVDEIFDDLKWGERSRFVNRAIREYAESGAGGSEAGGGGTPKGDANEGHLRDGPTLRYPEGTSPGNEASTPPPTEEAVLDPPRAPKVLPGQSDSADQNSSAPPPTSDDSTEPTNDSGPAETTGRTPIRKLLERARSTRRP